VPAHQPRKQALPDQIQLLEHLLPVPVVEVAQVNLMLLLQVDLEAAALMAEVPLVLQQCLAVKDLQAVTVAQTLVH